MQRSFQLEGKKLFKNEALLSDILTLASFSPLLATTILQNPGYISWLKSQRESATVSTKEELLESLERFALLNSQVEPNVLLARFRRRELLKIYLCDIRRLGTIAEITEEISNLADAILEYAFGIARQELDNRYGIPLEVDKKDRARASRILHRRAWKTWLEANLIIHLILICFFFTRKTETLPVKARAGQSPIANILLN
ncbi:MAG: hypothetical protein WKF71_16245 [Pyrinomonadaceae bacterium]